MKYWKTFVLLAILGLLLSVNAKSEVIELTKDNHVTFFGPVNEDTVTKAQLEIAKLSIKKNQLEVIYLVIDSPGGSVHDGSVFIDFVNALPQKVRPICLYCASMGYMMFQLMDERLVIPSSVLMSHRVSVSGVSGQVPGEAHTRLDNVLRNSHRLNEAISKRVGLSREEYENLIYDELWLNGVEAVSKNHADKVVQVRCHKDLINGTLAREIPTMFGSVSTIMSACPLISGVMKIDNSQQFKDFDKVLREIKHYNRRLGK